VINVCGVMKEKETLNSNCIKKGDYFLDPECDRVLYVSSVDWFDDSILATQWVCRDIKDLSICVYLDSSIDRCIKLNNELEVYAALL